MRISFVIACLNIESGIGRCLESILRQDYPDIEAVVADGGSRDRTVQILRTYEKPMGKRLVWFSERDRGIGDAWNKALRRVSGDWVLFLGADDVLAGPDVISKALPNLARALPRHEIVCGRVAMVDEGGNVITYLDPGGLPREFRRCQCNLPHQGVFHHSSCFEKYGDFDLTLKYLSDYDFLLKALKEKEPLYIPEFTVCNMQIGGLTTNRRNAVSVVREHLWLFKRYVGRIPFVLSWWMVKASAITILYRLGGDHLALSLTNLYRRIVGRRAPLPY